MYLLVSPFNNTFDEIGLIYFVPDFLRNNIKKGQIVEIPLRTKIDIGVILDFLDKNKLDIEKDKIKSIISIKDNFVFLEYYQLKLISWIASYYFTTIHNSSRLFFPKNLRDKISKNKLDFLKEENKDLNYTFNHKKKLTTIQDKTYKEIKESKEKKILFYGVTGSGKTEIYIKLIKNYLDKGQQSLFLIPEIILTTQIGNKIKKVFGKEVLIITSNITEATKTKYWNKIKKGKAKIVLGTRSTLFYPYSNLGLIIVDEEHDNSYISDSSPRYNSIEVVNKISDFLDIKIVLGTGTPSIKSMYLGLKGKYKVLNLLEKYK